MSGTCKQYSVPALVKNTKADNAAVDAILAKHLADHPDSLQDRRWARDVLARRRFNARIKDVPESFKQAMREVEAGDLEEDTEL